MSYAIPDPHYEELLPPGKKPIGNVVIDWSNPITKGLVVCLIAKIGHGSYFDLIKNRAWTPVGVSGTPEIIGSVLGEAGVFDSTLEGHLSVVRYPQSTPDLSTFVIGRIEDITTLKTLFNGDNPTDSARLFQFRVSSANLQFIRFTASVDVLTGTKTLSTGKTYAFGGTHKAGTGGFIYVDGIEDNTDTLSGDMDNVTPQLTVGIYTSYANTISTITFSAPFNGLIPFCCLWEAPLSPAQHKSLADNPYQFLIPA